jgi:molybdopterin converting factor small subunit
MTEALFQVRVELMAWATVFVGGDGSNHKDLAVDAFSGDTVRTVLKRLTAQHPDLDKALWHEGTNALSEHLEIAVNDALLGIRHTLDSEVKAGDKILIMGQYMGG